MSKAKQNIMNALNEVPDSIEDEIDVINNLYHNVRLNISREAVKKGDVYSTEEVRGYFERKRQGVLN